VCRRGSEAEEEGGRGGREGEMVREGKRSRATQTDARGV